MRFLCLHGAGTNNKIFEAQTAALRYELGGDHMFEFVEGVVPSRKAPAIERYTTSNDEYYVYYDPEGGSSFTTALLHLQSYLAVEGPFDGVLAFSQGTSLASALLLKSNPSQMPFRCAIFICGRPAMADPGPRSVLKDAGAAAQTIHIPTAHIWASNDPVDPKDGENLWDISRPGMRWQHVHENGHEVPGSTDKKTLIESVNVIRRMLANVH